MIGVPVGKVLVYGGVSQRAGSHERGSGCVPHRQCFITAVGRAGPLRGGVWRDFVWGSHRAIGCQKSLRVLVLQR